MKNWLTDFLCACKEEIFFRVWTWKTDREMRKYKKRNPRPTTTKGHP